MGFDSRYCEAISDANGNMVGWKTNQEHGKQVQLLKTKVTKTQEIVDNLTRGHLVTTNSGTFSGDPQWDEYRTYERVNGSRYTVGADPATAPGNARHFSYSAADRKRDQDALSQAKMDLKTYREELGRLERM